MRQQLETSFVLYNLYLCATVFQGLSPVDKRLAKPCERLRSIAQGDLDEHLGLLLVLIRFKLSEV